MNEQENHEYSSIIHASYDADEINSLHVAMVEAQAKQVYQGLTGLVDWALTQFEPVAVEKALMAHAFEVHTTWCKGCDVCNDGDAK